MTPQTLTTEDDYNTVPVGTIAIDTHGWAWQKISTTTHADGSQDHEWRATKEDPIGGIHEGFTGYAQTRGPHTVVYNPDPTEPHQPHNYQTVQDPEELGHLPAGTILIDNAEDTLIKGHNGLYPLTPAETPTDRGTLTAYAPYTIIHTPKPDPSNL